ncbi:MAG: molybdate ABC transporter substrate-binding protein [Proteobacteria bacterium]|nr:molybdate ABC transporter substrate-binding protein [Pseudomonadota bacterium]
MTLRKWFAALIAAASLVVLPMTAQAADVVVFAAASLTDALGDVGKAYKAKTGKDVVFSFAASSALARQIESSSGADMFMSADLDWMDYLDNRGLIAHDTRTNLLGNRLVLIAPSDSNIAVRIAPHFDLLGALNGGRLSVADPDSVPAGKYARTALTTLGVWNNVVNHLVNAENVRVALAYVARAEAPLGIVYATDAYSDKHVRIVGSFPDSSHPPIVYPVALTRDARPEAKAFLVFLSDSEARATFEKNGFTVLGAPK